MAKTTKFVDDKWNDFQCAICLDVPNPNSARELACCGHFLCDSCIKNAIPACYHCRAANPEHRSVKDMNKFVYRQMLGLVVKCTNSENNGNCPWIGPWSDYNIHINQCPLQMVQCQWKSCGQNIMRKSLEDHQTACDYRSCACEFCKKSFPFVALKNHIERDCLEVKTQCTCGEEVVKKSVDSHKHFNCPDHNVECEVQGCQELVQRKYRVKHDEEQALKHVKLLKTQLAKAKAKLVKQKAQILYEKGEIKSMLIGPRHEFQLRVGSPLLNFKISINGIEMTPYMNISEACCALFFDVYSPPAPTVMINVDIICSSGGKTWVVKDVNVQVPSQGFSLGTSAEYPPGTDINCSCAITIVALNYT